MNLDVEMKSKSICWNESLESKRYTRFLVWRFTAPDIWNEPVFTNCWDFVSSFAVTLLFLCAFPQHESCEKNQVISFFIGIIVPILIFTLQWGARKLLCKMKSESDENAEKSKLLTLPETFDRNNLYEDLNYFHSIERHELSDMYLPIDQFLIDERVLGEGAFGIVRQATCKMTNQDVCLKIFKSKVFKRFNFLRILNIWTQNWDIFQSFKYFRTIYPKWSFKKWQMIYSKKF